MSKIDLDGIEDLPNAFVVISKQRISKLSVEFADDDSVKLGTGDGDPKLNLGTGDSDPKIPD